MGSGDGRLALNVSGCKGEGIMKTAMRSRMMRAHFTAVLGEHKDKRLKEKDEVAGLFHRQSTVVDTKGVFSSLVSSTSK